MKSTLKQIDLTFLSLRKEIKNFKRDIILFFAIGLILRDLVLHFWK